MNILMGEIRLSNTSIVVVLPDQPEKESRVGQNRLLGGLSLTKFLVWMTMNSNKLN